MIEGLTYERELERLALGECADRPPAGMSRFELEASATGGARALLERTQEVLVALLRARAEAPGTEIDWPKVLPAWFVAASPPDAEATDARWSVRDFVYWFEPEQRGWWWWGAQVLDDDRLLVFLAVREPSFPHEALDWLLRASGAKRVVDENLRDLLERDG